MDYMTSKELSLIADDLCKLAIERGASGAIISLSGLDGLEHSSYYVSHRGRCLELEGLLERTKRVIGKLWDRA